MFCKFCGKQLKDNARFCSGCGKPCNPEEKQSAPAEPIAAPAIAQQAVSEETEQQPEPMPAQPALAEQPVLAADPLPPQQEEIVAEPPTPMPAEPIKAETPEPDAALMQRAENGDAQAMLELADWYYDGIGGRPERNLAAYWYQRSAEAGDTTAMFKLGYCYNYGEGRAQDLPKAVYWYQKAAEAGHAGAMCNLGSWYNKGHGVEQDLAEAARWFQKAAEAGHPAAMCELGSCYMIGQFVEQDHAQAVYWFQRAAEAGEAAAMRLLGVCYEHGLSVAKSQIEAFRWYQKAAKAGDAPAFHDLGWCYADDRGTELDKTQACLWSPKAAEAGHEGGKLELENLPQRVQAAKAQEIQPTDPEAMCSLGDNYLLGYQVTQDYAQAFQWYMRAAEAGHARAMNALGIIYSQSYGVPQDYAKARVWWQKSAKAGDGTAMQNLGNGYERGLGVMQDLEKARYWYQRAVEAGNEDSQERLNRLERLQQQRQQKQQHSGFDAAYADMLEKYAYVQKVAQDGNTPDFTVLGAIRVCLEQGLKASAALFHADINSYDNKLKDCIDDISRRGYASKDSIDILHKLRMLGNKGAHADEIKPWDMRNAREFLPRLPDIFREIYGAIPGASNRSGQRQSGAGAEKHQSTQQESTRICSKCAKINKSQDNFCIRCGNALASTSGYSLHEQVEAFKRISADDLRQWIYDRAREITITGFEGGLYLDEGVHGEDPSIIVQNLQIRYREQPTNGQYVLLYTASTDSFWKPARYRAIDKMYKRMQEDEYGRKAQSVKTLKREFNFMGGPFYMAVLLIWIPDETE